MKLQLCKESSWSTSEWNVYAWWYTLLPKGGGVIQRPQYQNVKKEIYFSQTGNANYLPKSLFARFYISIRTETFQYDEKGIQCHPHTNCYLLHCIPRVNSDEEKRKKSKAPIMFRIRLRCKASRKRTRSFIMPHFMHSRTFRNNSPRTGMNRTQHIHSMLSMP